MNIFGSEQDIRFGEGPEGRVYGKNSVPEVRMLKSSSPEPHASEWAVFGNSSPADIISVARMSQTGAEWAPYVSTVLINKGNSGYRHARRENAL